MEPRTIDCRIKFLPLLRGKVRMGVRRFIYLGVRAYWILNYVLSLQLDCRPVVDRQLLTFLASPRKCKQKKATAFAALRVPVCAEQKMGNERNSLRSDSVPFCSIFCSAQTAAHQRNSVSKAAATATATSKTAATSMFNVCR